MYLDRAIAEDKTMVECWKEDAEGMLVFVRLQITIPNSVYNLKVVDWSLLCCRSSVTHKIHPTIQRNPHDTSYYPARIYQQSLTQPNGSQPPIPSSLTDPNDHFVLSTSVVCGRSAI